MPALRQPIEEPRLRGRQVGIRDTDRLEAELEAPVANTLGEPRRRSSNSDSDQPKSSTSVARSRPLRTWKSGSLLACAKPFQGQTSWQSSQP